MTTETEVEKPKRKRKEPPRFIVTWEGVPCGRIRDRRMGYKLIPAGGTLVKRPELPDIFPGQKSAHRAVLRALRLRKRLTDAVCDVGPQYAQFMHAGNFEVVPHKP